MSGDERGRRAYQEIADNALAATGVQWVSLHHYDPEREMLRIRALAPLTGERMQKMLRQAARVAPSFDPLDVETPIDINPVHVRAYRKGETVVAGLRELAEGVLPRPVTAAIERITGVRWAFVCPFTIDGKLAGSMAFLSSDQLDAVVRHTCEAFARQAALTLEKDRLATVLQARVDELVASRSQFVAADERLRKELSLHLHGRVQTSLLAAAFVLDRCEALYDEDPERVRGLLAEVKAEVDRVRDEEIREVSHLLHPSVIDVALTPALRALADRYADRFTVSVEIGEPVAELDRVGDNQLPQSLRLAAYRIVEEALANTSQHGRPDSVTVRVDVEDGGLRLVVADDGTGFDPATASPGLGLGGIAYRVEEAGGRWDLESAPGKGTRISAWLPLGG